MMQSASTYRAVHAVSPGKLEMTEKPLLDPPAGHVRIRVEACGVCHSDSATVEGILPIQWPRVPGHEAIGRIDVVGQGVGIGFLGGACGYCEYCRDGDLVNCVNQGYTGVQHDGGYAEMMIAKASGLIVVPEDLSAVAAAPLLCAGLTTFSALRNASAGSVTWACSTPAAWASKSSPSNAAMTAQSCPRNSAPTTSSTVPPPMSP